MKIWQTFPFATALLVVHAQAPPNIVPLYRVTVVQGSAKAINYRNLRTSTKIDLVGTALLPKASGMATVKSSSGVIHIAAKFKNLPPASTFGGEFLTYVLWGISTEGRATNLGELILKGGTSKVEVTESLQTFGLVVTAEPYFAVSQPSDAVVMENSVQKEALNQVELIDAKYELLKRDQYTMNLASKEPMVMDENTPFDVYQARNAVRIAQASGASIFAPDAYTKAEDYLKKAEIDNAPKGRIMMAREAVQRAEDARLISIKKQEAEQVALDQKLAQNELNDANQAAVKATVAQDAAVQQAKQSAAENKALQSTNAGLQSTNTDLQSTNTGLQSTNTGLQSTNTGLETKNSDLQTANEGLQSNNAGLRSKLREQLNAVLQTRATARGLIVSMSGVLFQNGKATLMPGAREKLSKIAGILSSHNGLKIEADGFTDNSGNEASNQRLSEQRASNTKDYLVSQGVPAVSISSKGFGQENPIATNSTDSGRKENRRVELVVSGEGLTPATDAGL